MGKYLVNDEEFSAKGKATQAIFDAIERGESVTVSPAPEKPEEEAPQEPDAGGEPALPNVIV